MTRRRMVIAIVGAVVFLVAGNALYAWLNLPVASTGKSALTAEKPGAAASTTAIQTDYFNTSVDNMNLRPRQAPAGNTLVSVLAGSTRPIDGDNLAIAIKPLPSGGVMEVSDVNYRLHTPETYQRITDDPLLPKGAVMFRATDKYEVSLFWPHGDSYAAIVLTGRPDRPAQLEQHLKTILDNWHWL